MSDLFEGTSPKKKKKAGYSAKDIEVLEGLEPVRHRPGMYIGGTDETALHHLANEILDNAMDEAVAGYATRIDIELGQDNVLTIRDNGRGIPVDKHPKYKDKSALEVIMTTLHSGGKFNDSVYKTSGGLHGVGISVVNALSEEVTVEVTRDQTLYRQVYSRGKPKGKLKKVGPAKNKRGTTVIFKPDTEIFGEKAKFKPDRLFRLARSKAYLFRGVEIRWSCNVALLDKKSATPKSETFKFPNGLEDYLHSKLEKVETLTPQPFSGQAAFPGDEGRMEFAIAWPLRSDGFTQSYCNTVPTPQGGTHESGLRSAILRALKNYAELTNNKKAGALTSDDVLGDAAVLVSIFIKDPQFQGQTKDKLSNTSVSKWVDSAIKDRFEHWLAGDKKTAENLLQYAIDKAEIRKRTKEIKEMDRKSATRKFRLPGKLSDCSRRSAEGTELFLVEGDSAGGTAKQARNRETQAVLPLRGKVLNVASAAESKIRQNQEISDLTQALGTGLGSGFDLSKLRYERVIIMTDADVDGAHIASLLITFFYTQMRELIEDGRLYLAQPPLYRLAAAGESVYARDDEHKDKLMKTQFKGKKKVDISRFKGLGEMPAKQLKETTMAPGNRTLLKVTLPDKEIGAKPSKKLSGTAKVIDELMGKNPQCRFDFIQANAEFAQDLDI